MENTEEETQPLLTESVPAGPLVTFEFVEAVSLVRQVSEQNDEIIHQNKLLEERLRRLEDKLDRYSRERDQNLDELLQILKGDGSEGKNKSWLSRLRGK